MENSGLSSSDVLALAKDNDGNFNNNGFMWIVLFIVLAMNNRNGFGGSAPVVVPSAPAPQPGVTQAELTAGLNNVQTQNALQSVQLQNAQNDLNTVQAVNEQTQALLNRDYTNAINILNGYNNIQQAISNQTYALSQQVENLGYKMDQCCCTLQRQQLEYRNQDLQNLVNQLQGEVSNNRQTQQILGTQGRWVGWATSGTADATKVVTAS